MQFFSICFTTSCTIHVENQMLKKQLHYFEGLAKFKQTLCLRYHAVTSEQDIKRVKPAFIYLCDNATVRTCHHIMRNLYKTITNTHHQPTSHLSGMPHLTCKWCTAGMSAARFCGRFLVLPKPETRSSWSRWAAPNTARRRRTFRCRCSRTSIWSSALCLRGFPLRRHYRLVNLRVEAEEILKNH